MPTPFFADLVRELCQTGGTGPLTPNGAVPGHRRFVDAVAVDATFHYVVAGITRPEQWEVGLGRIDDDGRLLRDSVSASSNGGDRVDFGPGLKTIALTVSAQWFAASEALAGDVAALADLVDAKQPLSTSHAAAASGVVDDQLTLRRGEGWVNIPLAVLAFRGADGLHKLSGPLGAQNGHAAAPSLSFATDPDSGIFRPASDNVGVATGGVERLRVGADGRINIGGGAPNYLLNISQSNPVRGILADFGNAHMAPNGAQISFTQSGISNWCIGQPPGTSAFAIYVDRNGGEDGTELWRWESNGTYRPGGDNIRDLASGSKRIRNSYLASSPTVTSDAREKSWRGAASPAELRAAERILGELGFYQWNHAIAEKGPENARYHYGVRAQAVWDIMADEGLVDPLDEDGLPGATPYAFLCWDQWHDGETGEGGNRFGVRPDQLALFLIAAQHQRLTALEATA
jgi:hypothetical protein